MTTEGRPTASGAAEASPGASSSAGGPLQPVILGAVAQQLYQAMSLRGEGGKDFSAIVEGYRKKD